MIEHLFLEGIKKDYVPVYQKVSFEPDHEKTGLSRKSDVFCFYSEGWEKKFCSGQFQCEGLKNKSMGRLGVWKVPGVISKAQVMQVNECINGK